MLISLSGTEILDGSVSVINDLSAPVVSAVSVVSTNEVSVTFTEAVVEDMETTAIYNCRLLANMTIQSYSGNSTNTLTYRVDEDIAPGDVVQFLQHGISEACP